MCLIYSPPSGPWAAQPQLHALTVQAQGRACPFFALWLAQKGTSSRGVGIEVSPLWHPNGLAAASSASQALETQGDDASIHSRGPGSTSAECILQPDTPQTPQYPCSDIFRLQLASHLLCLEPLPLSGCCWPELLSWWVLGSLGLPTDYGDTETSTSGWIQEVLDQAAELRLDA